MENLQAEPLPLGLWLSELENLAVCCASQIGDAEDRALRRAHYLMVLSPRPIRRLSGTSPSELEVERLLEQGRQQDVAALIVGDSVPVRISPSNGGFLAVMTVDEARELQAEAATPALALVGAWARFLSQIN